MAKIIKFNFTTISTRFKVDKNNLVVRGKTIERLFSKYTECSEPCFDKILIANRGEIACRIIRTARKLGIKTVTVYSKPDLRSKHVTLSDESICIGPASANESYLNTENIINAVKSTASNAVHPGYGFLSENPKFVKLLEQENITFIGPSANVMKKMGDKLESKRLAKAAGLNIIPGYDGVITDNNHCVKIAREIGYPVMIKASAGGGGKGMRIAWTDDDVREGFNLATQEALSSFGDGRILLEKYINKPRHIEIQVLGDKYGNVIHLGERECSIQRRNQKIIEEAPSTFLDEATRKAMSDQALTLCKNLGYFSAGTIEFLLDENRNFYFLEMNTRLQVEHAVTEAITGVDLVEQMINVAAGRKLMISQSDVKIQGWAIESRIYAEDPFKKFGLPSVGKLSKYIEPTHIPGVRCDGGVQEGSDISVYYDPMISKLISHGKTRKAAIDISIKSLDHFVIRGVHNNIPLLRDILTHPNFENGNLTTNYLREMYPNGFQGSQLTSNDKEILLAVASTLYALTDIRNRPVFSSTKSLNVAKIKNSWHLSATLIDKKYTTTVNKCGKKFQVGVNRNSFEIDADINFSAPVTEMKINNTVYIFQILHSYANGNIDLIYNSNNFRLNVIPENIAKFEVYMKNKPKKDFSKVIRAPMPGLIKKVNCKTGDIINEGQELCVIEAMKMQNCIFANNQGKVKDVKIKENDVVGDNDIIIELE